MAHRTSVLLASLAALMLGLVAPALAQYPPGSVLGVSCTPEDPEPGETVECSAGDCDPGTDATVSVSVGGEEVMLAENVITTDENGQISFEFEVPEDAEPGDQVQVSVECEDGGVASVLNAQLEIGELAETGSNSGVILVIALAVVAAGGLLLFLARRRGDDGDSTSTA